MAYKFQLGTAKLSGSIIPTDDDSFDLGEAGKEFNDLFIDGTAHLDAINFNGTAISATAAELNKLDGAGADVTAAKLTTLCALSNTEIGFIDNVSAGTAAANKAVVLDASKDVTGIRNLTLEGNLTVQGTTTTVDSTTINISSSFTFEGPADAHETILDSGTPISDTTIKLPELGVAGTYFIPALVSNPGGAGAISASVDEINLLDGGTARGTTAMASGDGFIHNDAGTMRMTSIDKLADFFGGGAGLTVSSGEMSVSAAQTSITSIINAGLEKIGTNASQEYISFESADKIKMYIDDTEVVAVDSTQIEVAGHVSASGDILIAPSKLKINGTAVTATAAELNLLDAGAGSSVSVAAGDGFIMFDATDSNIGKKVLASDIKAYAAGVNVYRLSGSGTADGIIGATSGSGFYYNASNELDEQGLPYESVYMISGSGWSIGDTVRIKAPAFASGGKISVYAQSSSFGDFAHSIENIQSDTSGSKMDELGTQADDEPAIVLESNNAAVTLIHWGQNTEGSLTTFFWSIV